MRLILALFMVFLSTAAHAGEQMIPHKLYVRNSSPYSITGIYFSDQSGREVNRLGVRSVEPGEIIAQQLVPPGIGCVYRVRVSFAGASEQPTAETINICERTWMALDVRFGQTVKVLAINKKGEASAPPFSLFNKVKFCRKPWLIYETR